MLENYKLGEILVSKKLTLSSAESLTGGSFGAEITSHPGASNYFKGSLVTYMNDAKMSLGVKKETLDKYGAVSEETAREMCLNSHRFFNADVAISFTGNAGPTGMEGKPVGLVYIGIYNNGVVTVFKNMFQGDRSQIRNECVKFGVEMLEDLLSE